MIQQQTILSVADNTGAKTCMCIKVLGGTRRRYAAVGDVIVVAIKDASPRGTVKRHAVERAVIVRTKSMTRRKDGSAIRFDDNACVIIDGNLEPKGTRIFGPLPRELKDKKYETIFGMAEEVV